MYIKYVKKLDAPLLNTIPIHTLLDICLTSQSWQVEKLLQCN